MPSYPSTSTWIPTELWNDIWSATTHEKIKHFIWKSCHNVIPVKDNLWRKTVIGEKLCPTCNLEPESQEHMLLLCPRTKPFWFGLQLVVMPFKNNITSLSAWLSDSLRYLRLEDPNSNTFLLYLPYRPYGRQ